MRRENEKWPPPPWSKILCGKLLAPEVFYLDSATFTERGSLTQQVDTMCIISTSYLNKMIPDEFVLDNYLHLYLGKVQ